MPSVAPRGHADRSGEEGTTTRPRPRRAKDGRAPPDALELADEAVALERAEHDGDGDEEGDRDRGDVDDRVREWARRVADAMPFRSC